MRVYAIDVVSRFKFIDQKGIVPEKAHENDNSHSIGFCEKEKKWYGWSHRAYHGFGIGDYAMVCSPDGEKQGKKIKTLEEAKKAAIKFAESVS